MKPKDLTGQRFGRLTVISLNPIPYRSPSGKVTRRWDCVCDCGNKVTVLMNQLTAAHGPTQSSTRSCGCLQREKAESQMEDLTGQRFGRWTVIRKAELEEKTSSGVRHGWLCRCDCGNEKVILARSLKFGESKSCGCILKEKATKRLQEDNVLGRYKGTIISAIRPDRPPNRNNKSGVKGVHWSEADKRWIAQIGFKGKEIYLGRYKRLEDAARARREAEERYFKTVIEEYEGEVGK